MLSRLFLWFYCLSVPRALVLTGLMSGLLLLLHRRFRGHRWWNPLLAALLLCACLAIVVQTVLGRTPGVFRPPVLQPLHSLLEVLWGGNPELLRSCLMNVLLFYPLGLMAALPLSCRRHPALRLLCITALFCAFSCAIEYAQLRWGLGLCETDDVLHNTLGAFLGALVAGEFPRICPDL